MKMNFNINYFIFSVIILSGVPAFGSVPCSGEGFLVLAHGKNGHHGGHHGPWEHSVHQIVEKSKEQIRGSVELAFGMWNKDQFQMAIDKLVLKDVCRITIIPFYISSHSLVIKANHYMFGLSSTNPLHPYDPGQVDVPKHLKNINYVKALDDHKKLSEILNDRAKSLSRDSSSEELILVAHGPNKDEEEKHWLDDLLIHVQRMKINFSAIHVLTLRDDDPDPIRNNRTKVLRSYIENANSKNNMALILPVLLAKGGIEEGLLKRMEGLSYRYIGEMLSPDDRLAEWIIEKANSVNPI